MIFVLFKQHLVLLQQRTRQRVFCRNSGKHFLCVSKAKVAKTAANRMSGNPCLNLVENPLKKNRRNMPPRPRYHQPAARIKRNSPNKNTGKIIYVFVSFTFFFSRVSSRQFFAVLFLIEINVKVCLILDWILN